MRAYDITMGTELLHTITAESIRLAVELAMELAIPWLQEGFFVIDKKPVVRFSDTAELAEIEDIDGAVFNVAERLFV